MTNPRYVPEFLLTINGESLPAALRASISSVSYETGLEGADRVDLEIVNENLRWLDHPLLALDNKLTLSIGYAPDPLEKVFVGEIVSQLAVFPSGGFPTLSVAAQDRMHRLQQGTKTRWFGMPIPFLNNYPIPDMAVASMVGLENKLIPLMDPIGATIGALLGGVEAIAGQKEIRRQIGQSDFEFLADIARKNGWEMFVEHAGPMGGYQLRFMSTLDWLAPEVTLRYGQSLVDFTPRISNVGQIVGVTVYIWRPEIKMGFTVTVSWNWDRQSLDLKVTPGFGLPGGVSTTPESLDAAIAQAETPFEREALREDKEEVEREISTPTTEVGIQLIDEPLSLAAAPLKILSELIPRLNERLTGSGSTVGDPRIRAGVVMRLEGLGVQFSGLYRVTSATHKMDGGGYRTGFQVRKEIWFGSIPLPDQGAVPVKVPALFAG